MSIARKPDKRGVPIHPGEFLREDFLTPLGLSANALAIALRIPVTRISEIVRSGAASQPIQPFGWLDIFVPRRISG